MSNPSILVNYAGDSKPQYQTLHSAGCDLTSSVDITLQPGKWSAVPTGLFLEIPADLMAMVCPRSGLALKHGITVLNSPGIIDSDYRGEVKVVLINHSDVEYSVKRGDRIAQLIFSSAPRAALLHREQLSDTVRGTGGFGSTGK